MVQPQHREICLDEIRASRAEVRQLTNRIDRMSVGQISRRSPTPDSRRVTFAVDRRSPARNESIRGQAGGRQFRRGPFRTSTTRSQPNGSSCYPCGRSHYGECPAINVNCYNCGRRGHLSVRCREARRGVRGRRYP